MWVFLEVLNLTKYLISRKYAPRCKISKNWNSLGGKYSMILRIRHAGIVFCVHITSPLDGCRIY